MDTETLLARRIKTEQKQRTEATATHLLRAQLFLQCFHQFNPLSELQALGPQRKMDLFQKYCAYTAHVSRTIYRDPQAWERKRQDTEEKWPAYRDSFLALSRPNYQRADASTDGPTWRRLFLDEDVEALQQLKQHHVHLPKKTGGPRLPLDHCRDKKDPTKCKAGFPRELQLIEGTTLMCKGLAEEMGMPVKGKRSALGRLWGPCNDPNLNGNHPALLAALRCNGDVQVPYRFPITEDLHAACGRCDQDCPAQNSLREMTQQAQVNQAAQAGYACDYSNKRNPIAVNEVQEWKKSQKDLEAELQNNASSGYVGARVSKRLMTDAFARGVVRGSVECANLIDHAGRDDPTAAEAIKTAQVAEMSLKTGMELLQAAIDGRPFPTEREKLQSDLSRNFEAPNKKKAVAHPQLWTVYGNRGTDPRVRPLSAFEFVRYYHTRPVRYPWKPEKQEQAVAALARGQTHISYHALLTESGMTWLQKQLGRSKLKGGVDYLIREEGGEDWMPLGNGSLAQKHRHDWVIIPRKRPHVPVLYGALGSRSEEEHIMKILVLFCPWTSNPQDATEAVPYIGQLRTPDMSTWREALRCAWRHSDGFPTEELKRYILNYAFVYCLPRSLQPDQDLAANSDNEDLKDEVCHFDEDELQQATGTRVRGAGKEAANAAEEEDPTDEAEPPATSTQHDLTVQMMNISHNFWLGEASEATDVPQQMARHLLQARTASESIADAGQLLAAAQASRNKRPADAEADRSGLDGTHHQGTANHLHAVSNRQLRAWLESGEVRNDLNDEQHHFLKLVVERVLVEYNLMPAAATVRRSEEPMIWLLHGRPGTGKTHVLKYVRELFENFLGYVQGIDFQFTAFQATNAADIKGETLHAACGLTKDMDCLETACTPDTARRIAHWCWLIADEVGMISARLLGQVETRTRSTVPNAGQFKRDAMGNVRPFAGLNVIFSGDFRQLPPPEGGFLADLPAKLQAPGKTATGATQRDPLVDLGQNLFWEGAVQGVTELFERVRCKDDWWNEARAANDHAAMSPWNFLRVTLSESSRQARK